MNFFSADLDILLRSLAIRKMIEFENPEHLSEGKRRFQKFEDAGYEIPADLRVGVYKAHLFGGGIETVQNLLKVLLVASLSINPFIIIIVSLEGLPKDGFARGKIANSSIIPKRERWSSPRVSSPICNFV